MNGLAVHTESLASILALLFLAANAGYTVVVEYCAPDCMAVCSMETCADQVACDMSCGDTMPAQDHASAQVESKCHKVAVAGGLNFMPMVSETTPEGQTSRLDILSCAASQNLPLRLRSPLTSCASLPSGTVRQHAGEKYVLHASLLM